MNTGMTEPHPEWEVFGAREPGPVVIAEYDPTWATRFVAERRRIAAAIGDDALRVEHVGSTSVPGLDAKPIVDILIAVHDVHDPRITSRLESAGYILRVREHGHRMLRTPERDVHVHLWPAASDDIRRHLLFRDWLRVDASDRALYERTKRELAPRDWADRNDYAEAKTEVITTISGRAEAWARRTGWAL